MHTHLDEIRECPGCASDHFDHVKSFNVDVFIIDAQACLPNYCIKCVALIMDKMDDSLDRLEYEAYCNQSEMFIEVEDLKN